MWFTNTIERRKQKPKQKGEEMKYAIFCNQNGFVPCGSDSYYRLDGRNTFETQIEDARKRRESFKNNFPHKYNEFSHVMLTDSINATSKLIKL